MNQQLSQIRNTTPIPDVVSLTVRPTYIYALFKMLIYIMLSGAIGFASLSIQNIELTYLLIGTSILFFLIGLYKFIFIRLMTFTLTKEQLKITTGLVARNTTLLELYRVHDYMISRPLIYRLFNIMNFRVTTIDSDTKSVLLPGIIYSSFPQIMRDLVQQCRLKYRVIGMDN